MSVTEIQNAVNSIKSLPVEQRIRVSRWALAELEPEAIYAVFDQAFECGRYAAIIAETDEDYRQGRALSQIY